MDTKTILTDLRAELIRLDRAIASIGALAGGITATATTTTPGAKTASMQAKRRGLNPAARKTSGRRTMSAAARKKIAAAQRNRWVARKKAAKAA
jgi:hypothetical protein